MPPKACGGGGRLLLVKQFAVYQDEEQLITSMQQAMEELRSPSVDLALDAPSDVGRGNERLQETRGVFPPGRALP